MPVRAVIDSSALREAAKRVKEIDPDIRKGFIRDLKTDLRPYATQIAAGVPGKSDPPLSGMNALRRATGRTDLAWGGARASVYVTPGGGRGSLARIEIYGPASNRGGFKMVDLAGTSNYTSTPQGRIMNERLQSRFPLSQNGKGGRFAWAGFMKNRPQFVQQVITRLDQYSNEINRRFFL
jgi:hypothetical protein